MIGSADCTRQPGIRSPGARAVKSRRIALTATALLVTSSLPVLAQGVTAPRLAIFGVPLGASDAEIDQMARTRAFTGPMLSNVCRDGQVCSWKVNIENIPGTEFISTKWGHRTLPDRMEAFSFAFTAPPNEHRIWSAGSDQTFGDQYNVSAAAPMLSDVLAELRQRFGEPVRVNGLGRGGAELGWDAKLWWLWDANGHALRSWTTQTTNTCHAAIGMASVEPGTGALANRNVAPVEPRAFLLARQGNCARAVEVGIAHRQGHVYKLKVRVIDFQAGHDSQFYTNRFLNEQRRALDAQRSSRNRPDF